MNFQRLVLGVVLGLTFDITVAHDTENVTLITKNDAYYKANLTWTLKNFFTLSKVDWSIQSPYYPARTTTGIQWFLIAVQSSPRNSNQDFDLYLNQYKISPSINVLDVSLDCAVLDAKGNRRLRKAKPRYNILKEGVGTPYIFYPFLSRQSLLNNQEELVPKGHLTIQCIVEGFVRKKNDSADTLIRTEEKLKTEPSDCAMELARDTLRRLESRDFVYKSDVTVSTNGKAFLGHKEILSARSSYFKNALINSTKLDLSKDLGSIELGDLMDFIYKAKTTNLAKSCNTLYNLATKYDLSCLKQTCEDILIETINFDSFSALLYFAETNGADKLKNAIFDCLANDPKCLYKNNKPT